MATTLADGTLITYQRDATGRVVSRTVDPPTEAPVTIKYTGGGGMSMVLDSSGTVIQRTMSLPGGVQLAVNSDDTQVWSYPNLHGDVILTADGAGARTGRFAYDPFGQPVDPVTGAIGTSVADDAVPDNLPGDADHAFVGQHQRGTWHNRVMVGYDLEVIFRTRFRWRSHPRLCAQHARASSSLRGSWPIV